MVQHANRWAITRPACLAISLVTLTPLSVVAQSNPSADQIINQLRPASGMAGGTRGIRLSALDPIHQMPGLNTRGVTRFPVATIRDRC